MPGLDLATQESAPNIGDMTNAEIGDWINSAPNKEERNIRKVSAFVRLNMGGPEKLKAASGTDAPKKWYTARQYKGTWFVYCTECKKVKPVWNDEGTGIAGDIPEHCNPVCKECADKPSTEPTQGAQLRSLFDALHQAMIKYSPPIYPVDLALVTLKEALDQIP